MRKLALAVTPVLASLVLAVPAFAGAVDPNTLQPVPPNATCKDAGQQIICDTFVEEFLVNAPNPDFELPCGTVYETSHYRGDATRWYVDRLVVQRHVPRRASSAPLASHRPAPDRQSRSAATGVSGASGRLPAMTPPKPKRAAVAATSDPAPRFGVILHDTGVALPDGTHHGLSAQIPVTPEVAATLCAALTT